MRMDMRSYTQLTPEQRKVVDRWASHYPGWQETFQIDFRDSELRQARIHYYLRNEAGSRYLANEGDVVPASASVDWTFPTSFPFPNVLT